MGGKIGNMCPYCGSEMEYYDGGDPGSGQETWSCTGCDHVCLINSDTGAIECECQEDEEI